MESPRRSIRSTIKDEVEPINGRSLSIPEGWSDAVLAYLAPDMRQEFTYGSMYDPKNPTHLVVFNYIPSGTDLILPEPTEIFEFSAPFEILCVRAKTKDHFYVAGRTDLGDDIIERWKKALTAISGSSPYVMQRMELYRGPLLGGTKSIGIDHEERYLHLLHGSPTKLSKMALPAGTPAVLYNNTQIPQLRMDPISVFQRRHMTLGIVWTVEGDYPDGSSEYVLFFDPNDDGVMDSWSAMDSSSYFPQYSVSAGVWQDVFMGD